MISQADIEDYLNKSGDEYLSGDHVIENEHGFLTYSVTPDCLFIINCYGDGEYWDKVANDLAKEAGKDVVRFGTRRNPKTFERKYGYKTVGYILEKEVI